MMGKLCLSCRACQPICYKIGSLRILDCTLGQALGMIHAEVGNRSPVICCERIAHVNRLRSVRLCLIFLSFSELLRDNLLYRGEPWQIYSLSAVWFFHLLQLLLTLRSSIQLLWLNFDTMDFFSRSLILLQMVCFRSRCVDFSLSRRYHWAARRTQSAFVNWRRSRIVYHSCVCRTTLLHMLLQSIFPEESAPALVASKRPKRKLNQLRNHKNSQASILYE